MKPSDLEPLPPDLERLLDAERRAPGLSPVATERVGARLDASIAAIGRRPPFWGRRGPLAVTSFVLGLIAGAALMRLDRRTPLPLALPSLDPPVPTMRAPVDARIVPTVVARTAPSTPAPVSIEARDDDLAAERALLDVARTGVARGQPAAALDALERHARRFPRGRLTEERDSLRVQCLVQLGRADDARREAAQFHRRHPNSLLGQAVDAAVRAIP
jgi:hypothetical protein